MRSSVYSRWDGSQEGFSLDPDRAFDAMSELMMEGLSAQEALEWMRQHGFAQADWEEGTIGDLVRAMPPCELITADATDKLGSVVEIFKEHGISQIPVLDEGRLAGILTESDVLQFMVSGRGTNTAGLT